MRSKELRADILLILTALIWGSAFVAQRVGMDHVGPFTFNGMRFVLGAAALAPLAIRSHGAQAGSLTGWRALAGGTFAGLLLFIGASLQQVGLIWTTAGNAGFITGLYVVIVPFLGLFFGQRPGIGSGIGAALAVSGMYYLSVTNGLASINKGDVLMFIGAFFWAAHVLLLGWLAPRMNPIRLSCMQFACCAALSLATALGTETITVSGLTGAALPILYGGLMSTGVAYTLQVVAQQDAPPTHAAIILSLEGAFAALTGWLFLGETLTSRALVGCALMFAGILTAELAPREKTE
jgi:drug/metabolite transporter (DMT)-like permease